MSMFRSDTSRKRQVKYEKKARNRTSEIDPAEERKLPIYQYASENPLTRVFTWGMACYGALGVPEHLRPKQRKKPPLQAMHRPARCGFAETERVKDVACGYGFTVFALDGKESHIMGTGINKDGQIGYHAVRRGHPLEMLIQPRGVTLPVRDRTKSKAVAVAAGRAHTLVLTNDGDVFSLGNNAYGQCGRQIIEDEDYFMSRVIHRVEGQWQEDGGEVTDILCGQDHSLFLSSSGTLYSCGWGADGQTGKGHYDVSHVPSKIRGDLDGEKVVKAASKADCVLALNDRGEVFGWGNSEYGQFSSVTDEQQINTPTKLDLTGIGKVIDVACGGTVCMVLNDNRDVFVWGFGILGKGPALEFSRTPVQIPNTLFGRNEFSPDVGVTSVHAGVHIQAAINSNGELFTWGKNKGKCLGLGDDKDQYFPLKVSLVNEVLKLNLGVDHSAALCKPWV